MDGMVIGLPHVPPVANKRRELSDEERIAIASSLQTVVENDKLPWGALARVAKKVGFDPTTVSRVWARAKEGDFGPLNNIDAVRSRK